MQLARRLGAWCVVAAVLAPAPVARGFHIVVSDAASRAGVALLQERGHRVVETGPLGPAELAKHEDADAVIVASSTKVTAEYMGQAKNLRVVGRAGAGLDNIDTAFAAESGIAVVRAGDGTVSAASVAELAFMHMLALSRRGLPGHASIAANTWKRRDFVGSSLTGKHLGIVGLGRIGKQVASRAAAFGMRVSALARDGSTASGDGDGIARLDFESLLRESDVISIHCPLTPETTNIFDAAAFDKMKASALLVNCGRGGVVDEEALLHALREGKIAGAGLDVLRKEGGPELERHVVELAELPNCFITPHLGASTYEAADEVAFQVAEATLAALEGAVVSPGA